MPHEYRRIPYGIAMFDVIRRDDKLYVDKTRFLQDLENYTYVFLIRPRRFGKSCWVSLLEHYYDCKTADRFDELFLAPFLEQYPDANYGFLIELKYLKREKTLDEKLLQTTVDKATSQLKIYL